MNEKYIISEEENVKIIKCYFKEGQDGPLCEFPVKEKRKFVVLSHLLKRFEPGKKYTEKEVNEILRAVYSDYATLRRHLVDYGMMDRMNDCSFYWVNK